MLPNYHEKIRAKAGCPGGCPGQKKGGNATPKTRQGNFNHNTKGGGYAVPKQKPRKNGW